MKILPWFVISHGAENQSIPEKKPTKKEEEPQYCGDQILEGHDVCDTPVGTDDGYHSSFRIIKQELEEMTPEEIAQ